MRKRRKRKSGEIIHFLSFGTNKDTETVLRVHHHWLRVSDIVSLECVEPNTLEGEHEQRLSVRVFEGDGYRCLEVDRVNYNHVLEVLLEKSDSESESDHETNKPEHAKTRN